MTSEQLCALALQAIDDADARVVLADAIIEADWWDERVSSEPLGGWSRKVTYSVLSTWDIGDYSDRARAIAAVLLFGDWPTRWELAERCPMTLEEQVQMFTRRIQRSFEAIARLPPGASVEQTGPDEPIIVRWEPYL